MNIIYSRQERLWLRSAAVPRWRYEHLYIQVVPRWHYYESFSFGLGIKLVGWFYRQLKKLGLSGLFLDIYFLSVFITNNCLQYFSNEDRKRDTWRYRSMTCTLWKIPTPSKKRLMGFEPSLFGQNAVSLPLAPPQRISSRTHPASF